jgi:hypothetical protein
MRQCMRGRVTTYLALRIPLTGEDVKSLRKRGVGPTLRQVDLDRGGGDERRKSEGGDGKKLERHFGHAGERARIVLLLPFYTTGRVT